MSFAAEDAGIILLEMIMRFGAKVFLAIGLALVFASVVSGRAAELWLPSVFSDHAVLQRGDQVPVWGRGPSESTVAVELGDAKTTAETDSDGRWAAVLDLSTLGEGPFEMIVKAGENEIRIKDVLVGEVWLASGQSNMAWPLRRTLRGSEAAAASANNQIRQFIVASKASTEPAEDVVGKWLVAGPSTTGGFSAVAYYFSKILQAELGGPVGILNATWGASVVESWTSAESLASIPVLAKVADSQRELVAGHPAAVQKYNDDLAAWFEKTGRADQRKITGVDELPDDTEAWTEAEFSPDGKSTPEPGAVWYRGQLTGAESDAGQAATLLMVGMEGEEELFLNGVRLRLRPGAASGPSRSYTVPGQLLKSGENSLVVRVFSPVVTPTFKGSDVTLVIDAHRRLAASDWTSWREFSLPSPDREVVASLPKAPDPLPTPNKLASQLFNGMISPLAPYSISGVIWYQGESNVSNAQKYRLSFPLLIQDWRGLWGRDDLPFYWCQLSAYRAKSQVPGDSAWADLREAQASALMLPHTGQAVTIDVGEASDIHPSEKEVVGRRLAAIALAQSYGKDIPHTGPVFESLTVDGAQAVLKFSDTAGGLVAAPVGVDHPLSTIPSKREPLIRNSPESELEGFAISDSNGAWHWADARIDGDTVVVSSPSVPEPVAVRYGWADNPTANLFGKNGFPAAPFRTDAPKAL